MSSLDLTGDTPPSSTPDTPPSADLEVTVSASDLLWLLMEFGILVAAAELQGIPVPPCMEHGAVDRLVDVLPIESVILPPEARLSAAIADIIAEEGL